MPTPRRTRSLAIAALAVLVGLGVVAVLRARREPRSIEPSLPATADLRSARAPLPAAAVSARSPDESQPEPSPPVRPVHLVVDDVFGGPVLARVTTDAGDDALSDPRTGVFLLGEGAWSRIRASAAGYADLRVERDAVRPEAGLELRMRGAREGGVLVQGADGRPAPAILVEWRPAVAIPRGAAILDWMDTRAQPEREPLVARTDAGGLALLPLAEPALATVRDPRGPQRVVRVLPGQRVVVALPETLLVLRVVRHATQAPLAGFELDAWSPRDPHAMSDPLATDARGEVTLAPSSYPVVLRRADGEADQGELIATPGTPYVRGDPELPPELRARQCLRIDAPSAEPIVIAVGNGGARVRLVDAVTGIAIDAPVRAQLLARRPAQLFAPGSSTAWSPRRPGFAWERFEARAGILELPGRVPAAALRGEWDRGVLALSAEGYQPFRIEPGVPFDSEADGTPLLRLSAASRRSLRIVDEQDAPHAGPVLLHSQGADFVPYASEGALDGLHGPFDWCGGDLHVETWTRKRQPWIVGAQVLAESDLVTLRIPLARGSIVVAGVPPEARAEQLVATRGGVEHAPDELEPGRVVFRSLACGAYAVGPRSWIRAAAPREDQDDPRRPARAPQVEPLAVVEDGRTCEVRWRPEWGAAAPIEGRVRLVGASGVEPFLVALHDTRLAAGDAAPARIDFDRASPRIALEPDGRYAFAAGEPLPRWLAVCVAGEAGFGDARGFHVVETLEPGESIDVATGAIELAWSDGRSRAREVTLAIDGAALRKPLDLGRSGSVHPWPGPRLRIDGVPLHVRELRIGGTRAPVPVQLESGGLARFEVERDTGATRRLD